MHKVLERQIKRFFGTLDLAKLPPGWPAFLCTISDAYSHADDDRALLTRSLELSSEEFAEVNKQLLSENVIVERKVKERTEELGMERLKLEEVARHMDTGAILLGLDGRPLLVNPAARRILDASDERTIVDTLTRKCNTIPVADHVRRSLAGETVDVPEAALGDRTLALAFVSLRRERGVFGALLWIRDITEQKTLEVAKSSFMAIASHEMRTPLTVIRGSAELLFNNEIVQGSDALKTDVARIQSSAVRLLGIVNDFLDVQSIEENKIPLHRETADMAALLSDIVADLSGLAAQKGISLAMKKPPVPCPPVLVDKGRLRQICTNLIGNAIHYTSKGGVMVWLENTPAAVKIFFEDSGAGISPEDQAMLFKKFGTGKTFLKSKEYGSGLGLYISSILARNMGGEVKLEKSEVGVGSVFSLTLPLAT